MRLSPLLVIVALGFHACIAAGADEQPPKEWVKTDFGHFFVYLPPDMKEQKVRGIDSDVRRYVSDSITISSDYGMYSDSLDRHPKPFETITINGKTARIITDEGSGGSGYYAVVHFPDTGRPGATLTLSAGCKDKADSEAVQRILRTISFK